jgi:protein-tyrosine phosphatase
VTRRGALVRASAIGTLTASGSAAMLAHGVRTIIDLRWSDEIAAQASPFATGLTYRNVPFDEPRVMRLYQHAMAGTMPEQLALLARPESGVRAAISAIADSEPAIVVHCQAGRDRTGAVTSLVLSALGVADEDVIADYCESDVELAPEYERFRAEHPDAAADIAEQQTRRAWVMGEFLKAMHGEYGGAVRFLTFAGVRAGELARLCNMLVDRRTRDGKHVSQISGHA